MKPMVRIITGDQVADREMTDTEYAQYEASQAADAATKKAEKDKELKLTDARASAVSKLKALGLTDGEIKALNGTL